MEIRQLKTLVSILDHGGFAAAGEVLGLTQSAISLQVKALEQELGEDLFDRSKRPPWPTARALSIARKSRAILRMCQDIGNDTADQVAGALHLGAVPSVQRILLPKALASLSKINPDIYISVHTGLSEQLTRSVHRGILDAAIVSEPRELPKGMSWFPFASETLVVIAHDKAKGKTAQEILEKNPYIQFKRSTRTGELIDGELGQIGIKVKPILETDNLDTIWQIVASGMGVSVMPQHIPDHSASNNRLDAESEPPADALRPSNVKIIELSKNPVNLVTGLVKSTTDPKAHLSETLLDSLKL